MKSLLILGVLAVLIPVTATGAPKKSAAAAPWSMNATAIEACSCPMFCQCYFKTKPAAHAEHAANADHAEHAEHAGHGAGEHFCRFNNAYKVNHGHYGATKLDGAKFWMYGDLGDDFSQGQMDWAVVTFDKSTTPEQRKAIGEIAGKLFPVKWNSLTTAVGDIEWTASGDKAHATLDGGKTAEVQLDASVLNRDDKAKPMVMKNLKYWGANRNDGFVMMPNTVQSLRTGDKPYEFKGTNGFMITFDVAPAPGEGGRSGM
jgi:hypothetical protein